MQKITIVLLLLIFSVGVSMADERVKGHWRDTNHDGIKDTYVQPYHRTSPNSTKQDNYSTPGNYNPNRGEVTPGDRYQPSYQDRYNPQPQRRSIYDED